ncbi:hypothetical protein POM88_038723 [Heracleum sosnowskyi]|uniref:Uncharacterized protein n=1 Tax=Heracleum sosnowskyi TaxID=360622 RepID=A0AAD8HBL2_9APIA|nr:hypothetical protein POM88_038723 [Heracleum sosnowskyi]
MINTCSPSDPGGHSICDCDADSVVHLNGTLHWLALQRDNWFIISLNTKNGMCQKTLISPAAKEERSWFQLVKSGVQCNYLLVSRSQYHPSLCCCLLVYDESLKQLYKIDLDNDRLRMDAIGVRNNHEILFQRQGNYGNNELLVCNVGESKFKRFSPPDSVHIHWLQPFVETLVLLNDEDSSSTENTGYPS